MELDAVDPKDMSARRLDHSDTPIDILTPTLLEGVVAYLMLQSPASTRQGAAVAAPPGRTGWRLEKCNRAGGTSLFVFTRRHEHAPDWQATVTVTVDCARRQILRSCSTGYQPAAQDDAFFCAPPASQDVRFDAASTSSCMIAPPAGIDQFAFYGPRAHPRGNPMLMPQDNGMAVMADERHARGHSGQEHAGFRALNHNGRPIAIEAPTLIEGVVEYLRAHAAEYGLPDGIFHRLAIERDAGLLLGRTSFRLEHCKTVMDTSVFVFAQTYAGLPIWQAALTVTVDAKHRRILSSSSTAHDWVQLTDPPHDSSHAALSEAALRRATGAPPGEAQVPDGAGGALCIEKERLIVYRYEAGQRSMGGIEATNTRSEAAHEQDFVLPLPKVPDDVVDGAFYVVREVLFTKDFHGARLHWLALVELRTGAVLYLRAFASPIHDHLAPGGREWRPDVESDAMRAALDALRDSVRPASLRALSADVRSLRSELVRLRQVDGKDQTAGEAEDGFDLSYDAESVRIGASNAYDHCDQFFRMVLEMGFPENYFGSTVFPMPIDHRGFGGTGLHINAHCMGTATGIASVDFAFADLPELTHPLGFAADRHVVLHELGGHGVLYAHVGAAHLGFAHSTGDAIAAILCDPDGRAVDRYMSYPWVDIGRRHDREPEAGWGWASESAQKPFSAAHDRHGYRTEQILSTTLFRLYRSIGGDSQDIATKRFAARTAVYLVLHAIGLLTPTTNPRCAEAFELALESADASDWVQESPSPIHAGGAYWKTIRWAFERQGMFQPPGTALPADRQGAPPPVDIYIDDGRHGEYGYQPEPERCLDIWNRTTLGHGTGFFVDREHQAPIAGQINYAYVRIRNRGTMDATGVVVRGFQGDASSALNFPGDWRPMAEPVLAAPDLAAGDREGQVVGPFAWVPDAIADQAMLFSVSAHGDPANIDGRVTGPVPAGRLVPHDNNLAQRNVTPLPPNLPGSTAQPVRARPQRRFWSRARPLRHTLDNVFGLGDEDALLV